MRIVARVSEVKTEHAWSWGASENIVWEGHDAYANLKPGIATILGYDPEDPKNAVMPFEESVEIIQDRMGRAVEEVVRKA